MDLLVNHNILYWLISPNRLVHIYLLKFELNRVIAYILVP